MPSLWKASIHTYIQSYIHTSIQTVREWWNWIPPSMNVLCFPLKGRWRPKKMEAQPDSAWAEAADQIMGVHHLCIPKTNLPLSGPCPSWHSSEALCKMHMWMIRSKLWNRASTIKKAELGTAGLCTCHVFGPFLRCNCVTVCMSRISRCFKSLSGTLSYNSSDVG